MSTSSPGSISALMALKMACLPPTFDALCRSVTRAKLRRVPVADSLAQRQNPGCRGVLGKVLLDGADAGALDVLRGGEVGLAGTEIHHVDAASLVAFCLRQYRHGGGDRNAVDALGELHSHIASSRAAWGTLARSRRSTAGGTSP